MRATSIASALLFARGLAHTIAYAAAADAVPAADEGAAHAGRADFEARCAQSGYGRFLPGNALLAYELAEVAAQ